MITLPKVVGYKLVSKPVGAILYVVFDPRDKRVMNGDCVPVSGVESVRSESGNYCKPKTLASLKKHGIKMAKFHNVPFSEMRA